MSSVIRSAHTGANLTDLHHEDHMHSVQLSPEAILLATLSHGGTIRLRVPDPKTD